MTNVAMFFSTMLKFVEIATKRIYLNSDTDIPLRKLKMCSLKPAKPVLEVLRLHHKS